MNHEKTCSTITCMHRSGFRFPLTDLRVLISCCLLQVDAKKRIVSMHDHLRDLAYKIVREEGGVGQRTRLLGRDAADALKEGVRAQSVPSCYITCCRIE